MGITLPFGFTVRRIRPLKPLQFLRARRKSPVPVYVEFVGAPAVGKSTLYTHLNKRHRVEWMDIKHFSHFHYDKPNVGLQGAGSPYQYLAEWRLAHLVGDSSTLRPVDRLEGCSSSFNVLREDALVHLHNKRDVILSEEGIFQFFGKGIGSLYSDNFEQFNSILSRRAIVYCVASPDLIVQRIRKRKMANATSWYGHNVSTAEELYRSVKDTLDEKSALIELLRKYIPVLEINTEDSLGENEKKIRAFITTVMHGGYKRNGNEG